jgi:HAE1 family hydrophobic/amphiphilic exporter-1
MLPLALGLGSGGEMRAPMARAVIGGLITSTLLTLVVVPVVYTLLDDLSTWVRQRRRKVVAAAAGASAVVMLLAGPGLARVDAQESTLPIRTVTLDEALAIAAAQNRDVLKAAEYRNWVEGKYLEERASALPQASFSGNVLREFDDSQSRLFRNVGGFGGERRRRRPRSLRRPAGCPIAEFA